MRNDAQAERERKFHDSAKRNLMLAIQPVGPNKLGGMIIVFGEVDEVCVLRARYIARKSVGKLQVSALNPAVRKIKVLLQ